MSDDDYLVEHFSGICHKCKKYVDGRRHNACWNPILGLSHANCADAAEKK